MCSCTSHERCKTSPSYQKSPSRPIQEVPRAAITIEHTPQYGVQHTPPRRCPTLRNSRWNRLALELLIWMRHSPQSSLPRRQLIEWIGKLATKGTHLLWWTSKVFFFFFFNRKPIRPIATVGDITCIICPGFLWMQRKGRFRLKTKTQKAQKKGTRVPSQ